MAKTNFSKAEEALSEAINKFNRQKLLGMADEASGAPPLPLPDDAKRAQLISALEREIKRLHYNDRELFKKLGIKKKTLETWVKDSATLTDAQWEKVLKTKERLEDYIKQKPASPNTDEQIVESQRHKHINKRFNVNDKWLPLK